MHSPVTKCSCIFKPRVLCLLLEKACWPAGSLKSSEKCAPFLDAVIRENRSHMKLIFRQLTTNTSWRERWWWWEDGGGCAFTGSSIQVLVLNLLHLGEVYTWGDNDEGQLGDGTTNAIQRPRLVAALQGKKVNRVACGSAHTLAWSTSKPASAGKLPTQVRTRWARRCTSSDRVTICILNYACKPHSHFIFHYVFTQVFHWKEFRLILTNIPHLSRCHLHSQSYKLYKTILIVQATCFP